MQKQIVVKHIAFVILVLLVTINPAYAQSRISHSDAAKLASHLGISTTRLWLEHDQIYVPPSNLPPAEQNSKIESALKRYEAVRNGYSVVSTATSGMQLGVGGLIGGTILYGGPQALGTIPLTLLGAASYISLDLTNAKVEQIGNKRARQLLAKIAEDLVEEAGVEDYTTLTTTTNLVRDTIKNSNRLLQDIKRRALEAGDPSLVNMATDVIQRVAMKTDEATLNELSRLDSNVSELDANFAEFVEEVQNSKKRIGRRLEQHKALLGEFGEELHKLEKNVEAVNDQLGHLGQNQTLVTDFLFSSLPPNQKVVALRSGSMDDRIRCPADQPSCNPAKIKAALIERYETETRVKKSVADAGKILQGINDISDIMGNLGLDIGEHGNQALQIAGSAVNAYMGFMSGNYLGAMASVTGMFSKRSDPDQERFQAMMKYMQEQFEVINKKLNAVLENQKKIADAVVSLSKQLERTYKHLDNRLASMQWEQRQTSENLKTLLWKEWRACFSMYRYASTPNLNNRARPLVDSKTLRFRTFEDVLTVVNQRRAQISNCLNTVIAAMDSLSATRWFGEFLNARGIVDSNGVFDQGTLTTEETDEAKRWRSIEQQHLEDIVAPANSIVFDWIKRSQVSESTLLQLQTLRISGVSQLNLAIENLTRENGFKCDSKAATGRVVRDLVCSRTQSPDQTARDLMDFAINVDILLEIADWMTVLSQVANLYDASQDHFATTLNDLVNFQSDSLGAEITRKSTTMMALAIAYYSRIYGGLTALALAEDILSGTATQQHSTAIANNPYLAENSTLLLLHLKRETWDLESDRSRPSFEDIYSQALLYAQSASANRFEPLYTLFGRDHVFGVADKVGVGLKVKIGDSDVFLPLPSPIRLSEGKFVFPPRYYALTSRQDLLIDTYVDYELGKDESLAAIVLQR